MDEGLTAGPTVEGALRTAPRSLTRAGLLVAAAMAVGNGFNFLYQWLMSRMLGRSQFGALGALLAISFIVSVVGLALQTVVARQTALRSDDPEGIAKLWASVLRAVVVFGVVLGAVIAAAAPALVKFLHLGSVGPVIWLGVAIMILPTMPAVLGMLQGSERFGRFAATLLFGALAKLGIGALLVELGFGVSGALAGAAAGSLLGAALGVWWTRRNLNLAGLRSGFEPELRHELGGVWLSLLGLFLVVNVDVVLARHFLPARVAGLYAVGSLVAKVAYWAPRFVVVVVFPRLAIGRDRTRLLAGAAAVEFAVSAIVVTGVGLAADRLLGWVFGPSYLALGPALWLFAAIGTAFTLVHLLLFAGIAAGDRRMTRALYAVAAVKTTLIFAVFHGSIVQVASVVLGAAISLLAIGSILEFTRRDRLVRASGEAGPVDVVHAG